MFVIVRDEDVPTVAKAVSALADDGGFEAVTDDGTDLPPFGGTLMLRISQAEGQVVIEGLEALDLGDGEEWARDLSTACSAEVIAIEGAEVGLLVHVYDEEAEPPISVVRKGNRWDTSALAPLSDTEEGEAALAKGLIAKDLDDLAAQVLAHLGATPTDDAVTLRLFDPLQADDDEEDAEPGLQIDLFQASEVRGKVKGPVTAVGPLFAVRLEGVPEIEGVRIVFQGEALALAEIEAAEVHVRTRASNDLVIRTLTPSHKDDDAVIFLLPDAYLASATTEIPMLDVGDLFSSMQALVNATSDSMLNTLVVSPIAKGKQVGSGSLTMIVAALAEPLQASADVPVHVTK